MTLSTGVEWLDLLLIAFTAQLAVLPGEKVQIIIASLSTRYNPVIVVSAAGTAFAGWTAVEIAFGAAVRDALDPFYLDVLTAAMFLVFAYLLYTSMPANDGRDEDEGYDEIDVSILGYSVPNLLGGFLPIFVMMAVGEFGDKTQWITITLAANYGPHPAIWFGEMLAIIPVSILNAYFFHRFTHRFDVRKAHIAGAAIFLFFALDTLLSLTVGFSVWESSVGAAADAVGV